ncbi:MAG: universal stress protein [Elainellaceae cyanobacterium]
MFQKILVALDSKESCAPLFEKALALAQATGAELMLISVLTLDNAGSMYPPQFYGLTYSPIDVDDSVWNIYKERYQAEETAGRKLLHKFKAQATEAGVPTQSDQVVGSPGRQICDAAKDWNADLIIVGSHGRKGLGELLLGSVSNYVMHHAPCSVLVAHKAVARQPDAQAPDQASAQATDLATAAES